MSEHERFEHELAEWQKAEPSRTWSPYYPMWLERKNELIKEIREAKSR